MKIQRIFTVSKRFMGVDQYGFNLNEFTDQLNKNGWEIKQIVSTTFTHEPPGGHKYPVLVITVLAEAEVDSPEQG
ncbi:MAG: hypothetical protein K2K45_07585 [Muribaculaceae bacterium]|nr:hypothetical protein [Muribaculaceae bacterium]